MNGTIVGECSKCGNEDSIDCMTGLCPSCEEFKPNTAVTYGSFKAEGRVQELELMAFCSVDSGEIEKILGLEHGDAIAEEYAKLMEDY